MVNVVVHSAGSQMRRLLTCDASQSRDQVASKLSPGRGPLRCLKSKPARISFSEGNAGNAGHQV